jgi:hypothetical protein
MTYVFWWHKPLHIRCAFRVRLNKKISDEDMRRCQLIVTYPEVTNDLGFYTGSEKEMLIESEKEGKGGEEHDEQGTGQDSPHNRQGSSPTDQEDATESTTIGQPGAVNVKVEPVTRNEVVDEIEIEPERAVEPCESSTVEDGVLEDEGPPPVETEELPTRQMLGVPEHDGSPSATVEKVVDGTVAGAEATRTGSALEQGAPQSVEVIQGPMEKEMEREPELVKCSIVVAQHIMLEAGELPNTGYEKGKAEDIEPECAASPAEPSGIKAELPVAGNADDAIEVEAERSAADERTSSAEGEESDEGKREDAVKSETNVTQGPGGSTGVNHDHEDAVIVGEADNAPGDVGVPNAAAEDEGEDATGREEHSAQESEESMGGKPEQQVEEKTRSEKAQDAIDGERYRYSTKISWPIFMFETARISLVEEWKMRVEEKRVGREYAGNLGPKQMLVSFLLGGLLSFTFALIHCAGWNFVFPTKAERMSWRACCCMIMGVPWLLAGIYAFTTVLWRHLHPFRAMFRLLAMSTRYVYILARLTMFAQVFLALRALPPLMLQELSWTSFIPHLR